MAMRRLTLKQEKFCQEYVKNGGNASAAYRAAYNAEKMKPETINNRAFDLLKDGKITARVEDLQKAAQKRNEISIDRIVKEIAAAAFFDPIEAFEEDGRVKPLSQIAEMARRAIVGIERREVMGEISEETIKVKLADKLKALDMLMRHLGGYERDNRQKQNEVIIVANPKEFDGERAD